MATILFQWLRAGSRRQPRRSPAVPRRSFAPRLEVLEDRTVPSFADPTQLIGVPGGSLVEVADLNNDARPDLVTANGASLNAAVNDGAGSYVQTFHVELGATITDVAVGKMNADAYADVVVASAEKTLSVFLGRADGTFQSPLKVTMPKGPNSATQLALNLAIGDLTSDGKADVVVGAESGTYKWTVRGLGTQNFYQRDSLATALIGKGDGTFRAGSTVVLDSHEVPSTMPAPRPVPVAIGDLNGDGKLDVVAAGYGVYVYEADYPHELQGNYHIHLLTGDGRGKLQENWLWSSGFSDCGWGVPSLAVRDLNGDGRDDIAAAYFVGLWGSSSLHISVSDPLTGEFATTTYGGNPRPAALNDVTGDGRLDVLTANTDGQVEVRPGNGDGTFGPSQFYAPGGYAFTAMAVTDLDGDGDLDLVLVDGFFALQMLNDGAW